MQRGDQVKCFKNNPESSPRLKGPKALSTQTLENILAKTAVPKVSEQPSYDNFRKVTQKPHFLKRCKRGTMGNFSKIAQKDALPERAQKHTGANGINH